MKAVDTSIWRAPYITQLRAELKQKLDSLEREQGSRARLQYISERIADLCVSSDKGDAPRCFLYIMFALVHQRKHGGLRWDEVRKLAKLGTQILNFHGIKPTSSRMSFLYGELHLALSHLHQKRGEIWWAGWEHILALHLSERNPPFDPAFHHLQSGIRSHRLGMLTLALAQLDSAACTDNLEWRERAYMEQVKVLRLAGRCPESEHLAKRLECNTELSELSRLELLWEHACREIQSKGHFQSMMDLIKPGQFHHRADNLVQAFLWTRSAKASRWIKKYPSLPSLARKKPINFTKLGLYGHCAQAIERCYDDKQPQVKRLERIGGVLEQCHQLLTLDRELLVWTATIRWLARERAYQPCTMMFHEYQLRCQRFSEGRSTDVFGLLRDLDSASWYQPYRLQGRRFDEAA